MNWIHGHNCIHNLISTSPHVDSQQQYAALLQGSERCVWAQHPFNDCTVETNSYEDVCEDFGYTLAVVEHPWNRLDVHELWDLLNTFNWTSHLSDPSIHIYTPEHIYQRWYDRLFQSHYSLEHYWEATAFCCRDTVAGPV